MTLPGRIAGGVLLLAAVLGAAAPVGAQSPELERTDSLIAEGRVDAARATLQAWWDERRSRASAEERQRARWLRAKLTVDPSIARRDYMRLVLEHPGGPHSADALLRLAQGAEAQGRPADAAELYEQLVREYPDSPHRLQARRWLDAHREKVAERPGPATDATGAGEAAPEEAAGDRTDARSSAPVPEAEDPEAGSRDARPVALQLGAFSSERGARDLAERVRSAGIEGVRLVRLEGSDLIRVRVGRFADEGSATGRRRALRERGFDVVLVENADRERPVS